MVLGFLGCQKAEDSAIIPGQEALTGNTTAYLSDVYVDGKLQTHHEYQDGRLIKTLTYASSGSPLINELNYIQDPGNRRITFSEPGYVRDFYYDASGRPIRQEYTQDWIIEYSYEKDKLVRILNTLRSNGQPFMVSDYRHEYRGNALQRIRVSSTRYTNSVPEVFPEEVYTARWVTPFNYITYNEQFPADRSSYAFSTSVKSPSYNLPAGPEMVQKGNGQAHSELIRRNSLAYTSPTSGMLMLSYQGNFGNSSTAIAIRNIVVNKDHLPSSYEQVTTSRFGSFQVQSVQQYSFRYITLPSK